MYDYELIDDNLQKIDLIIRTILERSENIDNADDFLRSPDKMIRLDAICMNLISLGEVVKGLDKQTQGTYLKQYKAIPWNSVMRIRDKIAHHHFEIDAEIVVQTIKEDLPKMHMTISRMIEDLKKKNK